MATKLTPEQAFEAAKVVRPVIQTAQIKLNVYRSKFPDPDRIPASVKYECEQFEKQLENLLPALAFLEGIAGRQAPTLS